MKTLIMALTPPVVTFLVCGAVFGMPEECKENTEELDSDARVIQLAPGERLKDVQWKHKVLWTLTYQDPSTKPRTYKFAEHANWLDKPVFGNRTIIIKEQ